VQPVFYDGASGSSNRIAGLRLLFAMKKITSFLFTYQSTFSPTPPPIHTFIENKDQTRVQPDGDRAVETIFPGYFDCQSRSIFSAAVGSKITN
jgi:hypothetical protein